MLVACTRWCQVDHSRHTAFVHRRELFTSEAVTVGVTLVHEHSRYELSVDVDAPAGVPQEHLAAVAEALTSARALSTRLEVVRKVCPEQPGVALAEHVAATGFPVIDVGRRPRDWPPGASGELTVDLEDASSPIVMVHHVDASRSAEMRRLALAVLRDDGTRWAHGRHEAPSRWQVALWPAA